MSEEKKAKILIVEDDLIIKKTYTEELQAEGFVVYGAENGRDGLEVAIREEPDIILLDISLPDMDGLTLCDEIRKVNKEAKIIGLTSSNEVGIITQLLQRGGNGYLLKNMERAELLEAIWQVLAGKIYLSKAANQKLLEQYRNISTALAQAPLLTRREEEILQLLNEGLTSPQIAAKLFLSHYTVETHRKNLLQKFNATNSQLLLKLARQNKLLE